MKRAGEQLVLDTNILVYWLRGKEVGGRLQDLYQLGERRPRPVVPVVVAGEIASLAVQLSWGPDRQAAMDTLLRKLPVADISSERVIGEYARIDAWSQGQGRSMGKNDAWIAAVTSALGAVLLTADSDFDHLQPAIIQVEKVAVS